MKKYNLLSLFGKGKGTYYVAGDFLANTLPKNPQDTYRDITTEPSTGLQSLSTEVRNIDVVDDQVFPIADEGLSTEAKEINRKSLMDELPYRIQGKIYHMKERESPEMLEQIILDICKIRQFKLAELASILGKGDNYLSRKYLKRLIEGGKLKFLHTDMINHPNQAYITV